MKRKTIHKVLRLSVQAWAKSIEDENVQKLALKNTIVTGGCIPSMLMGEKPKDLDFYFRDQETAAAVAAYYLEKFSKINLVEPIGISDHHPLSKAFPGKYSFLEGPRVYIGLRNVGSLSVPSELETPEIVTDFQGEDDDFEKAVEESLGQSTVKTLKGEKEGLDRYDPVFVSVNAIALKGKIQLIFRFFGEPAEIHSTYDFAHCMCYYDSGNDTLVLPEEALVSILTKELKYKGSLYPVCTIFRLRKFLSRGWTINAGEILKIVFQASKLDLSDSIVLEDQLIGVDVAYFNILIDALNKHNENSDPSQRTQITVEWLNTLIDRIFGK